MFLSSKPMPRNEFSMVEIFDQQEAHYRSLEKKEEEMLISTLYISFLIGIFKSTSWVENWSFYLSVQTVKKSTRFLRRHNKLPWLWSNYHRPVSVHKIGTWNHYTTPVCDEEMRFSNNDHLMRGENSTKGYLSKWPKQVQKIKRERPIYGFKFFYQFRLDKIIGIKSHKYGSKGSSASP